MLERLFLSAALLAAGTPAVAAAADFNYTYLDGGLVRLKHRDVDGTPTAYGLRGSLAFLQTAYVFGSYATGTVTSGGVKVEFTTSTAGVGMDGSVGDKMDAFLEAAYVDAGASGNGVSVSDTGYALDVGLRAWATSFLEVNGALEFSNFAGGSDTGVSLGAVVTLMHPVALALEAAKSGKLRTYGAYLRLYYK